MRLNALLLVFCVLLLSCEGPTGPEGPPGSAASVSNVQVKTGILTIGNLVDNEYWFISLGISLDDKLISVHVRPTSEYIWREPEWFFYKQTIMIYKEPPLDSGHMYRIALAY